MDLEFNDFDKLCRVCLTAQEHRLLIFDNTNDIDGKPISEIISELTKKVIKQNDNFPHMICTYCIENVKTVHNFKKQCENSYNTIVGILEKNGVQCPQVHSEEKATQTDEFAHLLVIPCEKCDEKFQTNEDLRAHRLLQHKGSPNKCRICSKIFARLGDLRNHITVSHPEVGFLTKIECEICSKQFTRNEHLKRHLSSVHKIDLKSELVANECQLCSATFESQLEFKHHQCKEDTENICRFIKTEEVDLNNSNFCEAEISFEIPATDEIDVVGSIKYDEDMDVGNNDTDYESDEEEVPLSSLVRKLPIRKQSHVESVPTGTGKNRYTCLECGKGFARNSHLSRHKVTHQTYKKFACEVCPKRFGRKDHLKNHMLAHDENKQFTCEVCNRGFSRMDHLKAHAEQKHSGNPVVKNEICEICNKGFTTQKYLQKHMQKHSDKGWKCKFCDTQFETKEDKQKHMKTHTQDRPYLCSDCGMSFVRKDYLVIHMRRHNGEKPYKCKYCDKGFPRAADLNVHEKYHTGDKNHLCTLCGKKFHRSYNLTIHMRTHTGERPYHCPHCPRTFSQRNDMKTHIRRHTGERFKCEVCGEGFVQGYHLTNHKRSVHGMEVQAITGRLTKFTKLTKDEKQQKEDTKLEVKDGDNPENDMNDVLISSIEKIDYDQELLN